jgi:predicted phosphodiesterase
MRLLHVSDLHLKGSIGIRDENILLRLDNFLAVNAQDIPFDHIVFTGDLKNADDGADINTVTLIINRIATAANLTKKECIHIVPGNHDFKREDGDKNEVERIRKTYDYDNGTFYNSKVCLPLLLNRFDDFFWPFCDGFYGEANPWETRNRPLHTMRIDGESAFIYLNSCLTCIDNSSDGSLVIGLAYLKALLDETADAKNVFIISHHPMQNFATREEAELQKLITSHTGKAFYWLCGDAHRNRTGSKDYINLYQVGPLTGASSEIPDFAIYDIAGEKLKRRVFRFLPHLNSTSSSQGGWKRVYIDPKSSSLYCSP